MFRTIKKIIKSKENIKFNPSTLKDEDGRSVLILTVYDDSNFLSPYSVANPIIHQDVASFIEREIQLIKPNQKIRIKIYSNTIDEKEKAIYQKAIRNYYIGQFYSKNRDRQKNFILSFLLLFGAVLIMVLRFLLIKNNEIASEIFDIAAWVFAWEAVDLFFFQQTSAGRDIRYIVSLVNADIKFYPLQDE